MGSVPSLPRSFPFDHPSTISFSDLTLPLLTLLLHRSIFFYYLQANSTCILLLHLALPEGELFASPTMPACTPTVLE